MIDEAAVPNIYWEPREPRSTAKDWRTTSSRAADIAGVTLSNPEPVFEREDK